MSWQSSKQNLINTFHKITENYYNNYQSDKLTLKLRNQEQEKTNQKINLKNSITLHENLYTHPWHSHHALSEENFYYSYHPKNQICEICFGEFDFRELVSCAATCAENAHSFCKDCITKYWEMGISDMSSWKIDNDTNLPLCPCVEYGQSVDEDEGNHKKTILNPHLLLTPLQAQSNIIIPKLYFEKLSFMITKRTVENSSSTIQCIRHTSIWGPPFFEPAQLRKYMQIVLKSCAILLLLYPVQNQNSSNF